MQQFELSEELVSQIEGLIKADNKEDVSKLVEPLHPADIAEIMNELDTKEAQFLFLLLDEEKAGDVLAEIEEDERQRFIDSFPGNYSQTFRGQHGHGRCRRPRG